MVAACNGEPVTSQPKLSTQDSLASDVLSRYCSGCHGLPKPKAKTAAQWPAIVWRMQTHRAQRAMRVLNESEIREITNYLTQNAKDQ